GAEQQWAFAFWEGPWDCHPNGERRAGFRGVREGLRFRRAHRLEMAVWLVLRSAPWRSRVHGPADPTPRTLRPSGRMRRMCWRREQASCSVDLGFGGEPW